MQRIVILGSGYGGIITALGLEKKFSAGGGSAYGGKNNRDVSITLVDQHDYQLFISNLYEIATAEEEFTTINQLKESIAIPIKQILENSKVKFIKAEVSNIDQTQKTVTAGKQKLEFDYLVVALGSVSDFFNIQGAEQFAYPLKNLKNAFSIRNQVEFALQSHKGDVNKKNIRIVVAGGGYTGVEFAAELADMLDILAWKNQYPREKVEVTIVEAQNKLIPGLSDRMSMDALLRLKDLGVRVQLSTPIFKIDEHFVELVTGEKMQYDVLVWTTGVKARSLPFSQPVNTDKKGRVMVNEFFQLDGYHNIFILGDNACIMNANKMPAPSTAQDAIDQAGYLAKALPVLMQNKKPPGYQGFKHGFIVSMGGKWAILNYPPFYFKGFPAYVVREAANLRYYAKVVGWWKAIKYVLLQVEVYSRND